nr:hypothetical protein [Tanacetum cinerariifolium]
MDIRDEIKLSKGDILSDSEQNKHRNKLSGVKAIDRVSSLKSKLKDTGKTNSPKSRWVPISERVHSPQPVTQYNPITGKVRKESEKVAVVKKNYVVSKSKVAAVVSEKLTVVNESVVKSIEKATVVKDKDVTSMVGISNVSAVVSDKSAVDDNPKVSKVSDESNKSAVVAPIINNVPVATETDKETEPVVAAVESVVEKDNPKVTSKVSDESVKESVKVLVVKKSVKVSSVVTNKPSSENQDKIYVVVNKSIKSSSVVADKRSSVVVNKVDVFVKKSVKASSVVADKPSSVVVEKLETDVVDYSSDEVDRKQKKLKIKAGLKKKRSGLDSSNSSEIDTKSIKLMISKLEKKVKKQESDEDSVKKEESDEDSILKKGKKKEKQLTPKEAAHEEYLLSFPSFHARTTPSSLFSGIKNSRVDILRFFTDIGFSSLHNVSIYHLPSMLGWFVVPKFESYMLIFDSGDKIKRNYHEFVRKWASQFYPLELKKVRVNDIAQKLIAAQEMDFLFKVNFLTLFTNMMGKADGLKGQICLDVVRQLREDSLLYLDSTKFDKFLVVRTRLAIRNWSSYLMKQRQELELKHHVVGILNLHDEWDETDVQESEGFIGFSKTSEKEGDLFGDNSVTLEAMNQEITPKKLPTQKGSPSPKKEL